MKINIMVIFCFFKSGRQQNSTCTAIVIMGNMIVECRKKISVNCQFTRKRLNIIVTLSFSNRVICLRLAMLIEEIQRHTTVDSDVCNFSMERYMYINSLVSQYYNFTESLIDILHGENFITNLQIKKIIDGVTILSPAGLNIIKEIISMNIVSDLENDDCKIVFCKYVGFFFFYKYIIYNIHFTLKNSVYIVFKFHDIIVMLSFCYNNFRYVTVIINNSGILYILFIIIPVKMHDQ
ncbi:hypothetical protein KUTeg_009381 [Tegillarca granosa]|uniref:Uncharacterized protein n=1 Tax=Tegillarca granosa TaxID=220873 RepID=A0ABQ9F3P2_TEGGR|nr:hypothetical protein KUTeg_009381 [Tegillarca granosa]